MFADQTHAGGEDGPRSGGAGPRRGQHHGLGGEHPDRQPLRPPGEDMEPRLAGQAGKRLRAPVAWPLGALLGNGGGDRDTIIMKGSVSLSQDD